MVVQHLETFCLKVRAEISHQVLHHEPGEDASRRCLVNGGAIESSLKHRMLRAFPLTAALLEHPPQRDASIVKACALLHRESRFGFDCIVLALVEVVAAHGLVRHEALDGASA